MQYNAFHATRSRPCQSLAWRHAIVAATIMAWTAPAHAVDEIQVYNADIAELHQWTIQQHLNYTWRGHTEPEFPGALIANRSLNGTPELAYGLTPWWELGFYAPWAVNSGGQFLWNGPKIRTLFVTPNAGQRNFFYGINFEFSYQTLPFLDARFAMEIRPIIGVRNADWEFIVNPIVDLSFSSAGEITFVPAARLARNLGHDVFIGLEYYGDLGQIGNFLPLQEQSHQLFAVTDFKLGELDFDLGIGYGLTPGSERLVSKAIISYAFPVPGKDKDAKDSMAKAAAMGRPAALKSAGPPSVSNVFATMR
jgi:hypothetical protein